MANALLDVCGCYVCGWYFANNSMANCSLLFAVAVCVGDVLRTIVWLMCPLLFAVAVYANALW